MLCYSTGCCFSLVFVSLRNRPCSKCLQSLRGVWHHRHAAVASAARKNLLRPTRNGVHHIVPSCAFHTLSQGKHPSKETSLNGIMVSLNMFFHVEPYIELLYVELLLELVWASFHSRSSCICSSVSCSGSSSANKRKASRNSAICSSVLMDSGSTSSTKTYGKN